MGKVVGMGVSKKNTSKDLSKELKAKEKEIKELTAKLEEAEKTINELKAKENKDLKPENK